MITIDTTNMCSHLQRKLFDEDGIYHPLWIAMQNDPELTAVVRSRQLHIYRNGKKVLVLAGKSALPNSANTMAVNCGNRTLLLMKQGIFPQTSNAEYYQKMVFGIYSLTIVIFKRRSNEETKNQVFGNILPLLVCTFGLAGGWSPEVPDVG